MSMAAGGGAASVADRNVFYDALGQQNLGPLWESLKGLVPAEPHPKAVPYAWRYSEVRPRLMEAGLLISAEEAERRVLVLQNPGLPGASQITDTIYAGLQLILPGEIAPTHRHSQSALRFVIEGQGGFTAVDGERTTMHPGDLIITPAGTWHDHGHEGEGPVVWMDGLDVPLVRFLGAGFREEHNALAQGVTRPEGDADARYGAGLLPIDCGTRATSPIFNYPYERTRAALESMSRSGASDPHHGFALKYVNPTNGDWAIPTIGAICACCPLGSRQIPINQPMARSR